MSNMEFYKINREDYYIDLHFTRELNDNEQKMFNFLSKSGSIRLGLDGRYYCDREYPKGGLFSFINDVRRYKQSIADALDKLIVHYGEYEEGKEKGKII